MKTRICWLLGAVLLLAVACDLGRSEKLSQSAPDDVQSPACDRSELLLVDEPVSVEVGAWSFQVQPSASGCSSELASLTESEKALALEIVVKEVKTQHLHLIGLYQEASYRMELAKEVNAALNRDVMEEVDLGLSQASESM
jgi:hypothetical protein